MPDPSLLTPLGIAFRDSAPTITRDDPDYLGIWHATARECERLRLKIELVREQFFPQTATVLLKAWEYMVGVSIEPAGKSIEERRMLVAAKLRQMSADASGLTWQEQVTMVVGPGWEHVEHIEGDGTTPPADTIRVRLPFAPDSSRYALVETLLREITPAHVDIVLVAMGGFQLDRSQMDQEGLGI